MRGGGWSKVVFDKILLNSFSRFDFNYRLAAYFV